MVSEEYKKGMKKYQDEMRACARYLPKNWIQLILKDEKLTLEQYKRLYNDLVSIKSGRSFRVAQEQPQLVEAIKKLSKKYKKIVSS